MVMFIDKAGQSYLMTELVKGEVEDQSGGGGGVGHHDLTALSQPQLAQGLLQVRPRGLLQTGRSLHIESLVLPSDIGRGSRRLHLVGRGVHQEIKDFLQLRRLRELDLLRSPAAG